ncbi:MAG: cytochrome-c peroxidase [Crocinitomicaceae bacterium]|jgi:cytochrome c peroxidase|nr:cytochrome-c peroxidase [Crocinitomicaceae bacterium]
MSKFIVISAIIFFLFSCKKDKADLIVSWNYNPTFYNLPLPIGFPPMDIPVNNPFTEEGIELGRFLFYEKKLSRTSTQACADCHFQFGAFSDTNQFSQGVTGAIGNRHAMVLQNLGYANNYFWDGRSATLEDQILEPVVNPIEMDDSWPNVLAKLDADTMYQRMFYEAFGAIEFDSTHVAKAIAQFLRTLVSGNSRWDKWSRGELILTPDEFEGFDLFRNLTGADCFHCHPHSSRLFTDHSYSNNGLDLVHLDNGLGDVTGNTFDNGKFKVPSLRNVEFSAPYMHDGRFNTLDDVIDHYSDHIESASPNISPLIEFAAAGGVGLTTTQKYQVKEFLKSLSDPEFINNPDFTSPF